MRNAPHRRPFFAKIATFEPQIREFVSPKVDSHGELALFAFPSFLENNIHYGDNVEQFSDCYSSLKIAGLPPIAYESLKTLTQKEKVLSLFFPQH